MLGVEREEHEGLANMRINKSEAKENARTGDVPITVPASSLIPPLASSRHPFRQQKNPLLHLRITRGLLSRSDLGTAALSN